MAIILITPHQMAAHLAQQAQEKRLSLNLSQKSLAEQSGVSLSVLKKFEHTGKISLESLLKLALVLGSLDKFQHIFTTESSPATLRSLDDLFKDKPRKRGRQ